MAQNADDIHMFLSEHGEYSTRHDGRLALAVLTLRAKISHVVVSGAPENAIQDALDFVRDRLEVLRSLDLRGKELEFLEAQIIDDLSCRLSDRINTKHREFKSQMQYTPLGDRSR